MAVLAECPFCHRKQSVRNKLCRGCGENLDKQKKLKNKIRYWIKYNVQGKQIRQSIGFSIDEARDADAKRKVQKRENRIFEMLPKSDKTFTDLKEWYLELNKVRNLSMYKKGILQNLLNKFEAKFGHVYVNAIKLSALENYQADLKDNGLSNSYIDQIFGAARTVLNKAFEDDEISGDCLRPFKKLPKMLKRKKDNARDRVLTADEFNSLISHAAPHLVPILATAYWTGMRRGEILNLKKDRLKLSEKFIKLKAEDTKDKEPRDIPILDPLYEILTRIPPAIHTDYVFLLRGIRLKHIIGSLKSACEKAGIPYGRKIDGGFTFHDLRHTFITNMRRSGVPEKVIMAWSGHSTPDMMHRYDTVDMADVKLAGAKLVNSLMPNKKSEKH